MTHDEPTKVVSTTHDHEPRRRAQPSCNSDEVTLTYQRRITPAQALYAVLWQGMDARVVGRLL